MLNSTQNLIVQPCDVPETGIHDDDIGNRRSKACEDFLDIRVVDSGDEVETNQKTWSLELPYFPVVFTVGHLAQFSTFEQSIIIETSFALHNIVNFTEK